MSILTEMTTAADSIVIVGHIRPDGDCVGSCLGVYNYLKEQYSEKKIDVYLQTANVKFSYLSGFDEIHHELNPANLYDLCICLDSGDKGRLGEFGIYLDSSARSICVDHHITNIGYAQINLIEAKASSTCELVFGLLDEAKISSKTAECLYTGLIHDTNIFKNSNTSAKTMHVAGVLMEKGINFGRIIDESFYAKTYVQNQILGRALMESVMFLNGRCIFTALRNQDMSFYGVTGTDMDGIVDQIRVTKGVEVAIFMYETDVHVFKVSMRSNDYVDVSKVAGYFGGGGHVRAAGCTMSGSVHDVINNLSKHIEDQMKEQELL